MTSSDTQLPWQEAYKLHCRQEAAVNALEDGLKAICKSQYEEGYDAGRSEGFDDGADIGHEMGGDDMADALFIAIQDLRNEAREAGDDNAVAWLNKAEERMAKAYEEAR